MSSPLPRAGFIGIALMDYGMAKNIASRGFAPTFLKRRSVPKAGAGADPLALGAKEVATAREVAANSDIIILCFTGSSDVESSCFGAHGIAEAARAGLMVVDTATAEQTPTQVLRKRGIDIGGYKTKE